MTPSSGSLVNMTDQQVAALTGGIAPARIAHKVDPNDVLAGKPSFIPYDGSDPQPGDALQFDTPNGRYQFVIADDGSWQLAGQPKAPSRETPEEAAAKTTATTTARIQAETANPKTMVRGTPRTGMEVSTDGGKTWNPAPQGNTPIERYAAAVEQLLPGAGAFALAQARLETGNGTQMSTRFNFGNVGNTDSNPSGGPSYNSPEEAAADWVKFVMGGQGDLGAAMDPSTNRYWKFLQDVGKHADIGTLAQDMQDAGYATDPNYAQKIAAIAGTPLPAGTGGGIGGVVNKQHVNIGGKEYVFDPVSGQMIDTGLGFTKPEIQKVNGQSYVYDPTTGGYKLAQGLPTDQLAQLQIQKAKQDLLSKSQLALSQQYDTMNYLRQALAAGAISPSDASAYYGLVKQQTAAQLAGTTAFGIYKQQQDFEAQQATNAKSLLDTQVTASDSLVKTLLDELNPSSKVPPLVQSSVPFDIGPVMNLAQDNIQRYIPAGLTQSAQQLLGQFYGPQPAAPGSVDASGNPTSNMPLSPQDLAGLGIGGDQGNQPTPASPPPDQTTDNTPSDQIVNLKAA